MEVKFTVSGPAIMVQNRINFDPNDPRKKAFYNVGTKRYPIIKSYYGTGGDFKRG
jgi:hypothetical protein